MEDSSLMTSKSVLVVEDDRDIRETLSGLLTSEGYTVSACRNGREALDCLQAGTHADVILLDLMMPVMNGWQFRVLQKKHPELASIPVLALSADDTPQAVAIDAAAYLRKPVDYERLLGAIERALLTMERHRFQTTIAETERLTSLGRLAAGVAHEINNPLAFVAANIDFAARSLASTATAQGDPAKVRAALEDAAEGCRRISQIVRDVSLFSRVREDERRPVDVRTVLDSAANMVLHEARARATIVRSYGDVPFVLGSEGRLAQVFLNLLLNAVQAFDGRGRSEIRLVTRAEGGSVVVEVHDTGTGIPEDVRTRIFDPFFTTKPIGVGTGLGLSIVHGIVAAHGGEISVESEVGLGTTFRIKLPATSARAEPSVRSQSAPSTAPQRARVLVIDDEEMIGRTVERLLEDAYDVVRVTRAGEALERIAQGERFDAILCDVMMPDMDGIDTYAAMLHADPDQAARMLFLTGGATNERTQAFLLGNASRVVEKPFDSDALRALVGHTAGR